MNNIYKSWLDYSKDNDKKMFEDLISISENGIEIEERFHKYLEFGTGGLRGILGNGSNRMNTYIVRKVSQALSLYLKEKGSNKNKVAIAYDSRNFSELFALEAAKVFSSNGLEVYLFDSLRPTPELSFVVNYLECDAGVVITASHNPSKYNGYKVYGSDGGQITQQAANRIYQLMNEVNEFAVEPDHQLSHINFIGKEVDEVYYDRIMDLLLPLRSDLDKNISIVYSPLHGSGYVPVTEMLKRLGFSNVSIVEDQRLPDGNFPTVKSPNPEESDSFVLAISLAKFKKADMIFATDPDCDRIGVAVLNKNKEYQLLTGNQIGALLVNYLIETKDRVTSQDAVIKTIVTSELGALIAMKHGATVFETLTGFKYIGEKINEFEQSGNYNFMFGYEESYGYLAGNFVKDKDAVIASSLVALMSAYYKKREKSLLEVLDEIYETYGYFKDKLVSFTYEGIAGKQKITQSVEKFRNYMLLKNYFHSLEIIEDYKENTAYRMSDSSTKAIHLPSENVIKLKFSDNSWVAIRPSGTEPKLKIYFSAVGQTMELAEDRLDELLQAVNEILK